MEPTTLQQGTKELHHRAEQHPIGAAMSRGDIDPQAWADWLVALLTVHMALDPALPGPMRRTAEIRADMWNMKGLWGRYNRAADKFAGTLVTRERIDAAAYVFTGAHLMGGAVMAQRIGDRLPTSHLQWGDRREALDLWRPLRLRWELVEDAKACFDAIIEIMDEIQAKRRFLEGVAA
jgi:hypothetical protein